VTVPESPTEGGAPPPLVVQYLYVHAEGEAFFYPSVRAHPSAARVAVRYLECALAQAASLRLQGARCDLALATNIGDPGALGPAAARLMRRIESLGVAILPTEYRHRPGDDSIMYVSSRYVLDAICSATDGQPADRQIWMTDLDCVWANPTKAFAASPDPPEVGCIFIPYPADWDAVGFGDIGITRRMIGELSGSGDGDDLPPWVGGEVLAGTAGALRGLVSACEDLDASLAGQGKVLAAEEQVLSLVGALGGVSFRDLSEVARRVQTGARHKAPPIPGAQSLGLWHLPGEKGLSLRRAASAVLRGRTRRLRRDLSDPARAARRFNVAGSRPMRQVRDNAWIASQRIYGAVQTASVRLFRRGSQ
jgi:hypothetical protein